jgi:dolichol kinase
MNSNILNAIILAICFLALFGIAEFFYHKLKVKVELTRKLVHVGTGLLTLLFPILLDNHWFVLMLCSNFALILIASLRFDLLKSINAIERESVGSIAYPVSVYGCYLAFEYFNHQYIYFYLPILVLAVCDPIAALTGKKWPIGKYKVGKDNKTLMGSGMFFLSAFVLISTLLILLNSDLAINKVIVSGISIALISCVSEALSKKGYDNITIPSSVIISLILLNF